MKPILIVSWPNHWREYIAKNVYGWFPRPNCFREYHAIGQYAYIARHLETGRVIGLHTEG